jgi:hypothetical protein
MLTQVLPPGSRIAALGNYFHPTTTPFLPGLENAARRLGLALVASMSASRETSCRASR